MLYPLPKKEQPVRCPVDDCKEKLEKDDMRGYCIHYCDIHGEVEPEELENECQYCGGTGEVSEDVWDEDSHRYHPTGTAVCICKIKEHEDE